MSISPALFPDLIDTVALVIQQNAEEVTALDQAIGDGDHVFNLQRGIQALQEHRKEIAELDWPSAWQKIGTIVMAAIGGASGSLYATLFIHLHKHSQASNCDLNHFADAFVQAIEAVKQRGKADVGEKTMLDVWVPVAAALRQDVSAGKSVDAILDHLCQVAADGVEATRDMPATKGRASFLGERSVGHIDAGAKTAQLIIQAVAKVLAAQHSSA
ncbi:MULTISPECIES: dihydroxyacetone kinase subunit DhaL [Methylomonas]|uniref:dihydroxyacetone kinase subunit DhaL n=1 Tax=Methylomonas TaxID=416 RepID=UPI0012326DA9|nr:dihydroxyacetone kinase subunit DhaL [Methylomonas rhizoryzae]